MILQGKTQTYALEFGINARCRVEEQTGRSFRDVLQELGGKRRPQERTVRAFLAALLSTSATDAGAVLADIGGVPVVRRAAQAELKGRRRRRG